MTDAGAFRDGVDELARLLHAEDPLDLGAPNGDLPVGEYRAEAAEILSRLIGAPPSAMRETAAKVMHQVFVESFGADDAGDEGLFAPLTGEAARIAKDVRGVGPDSR